MALENLTIELIHQAGDWPEQPDVEKWINRALATTVEVAKLQLPPGAELNIVLSNDDHVRELNSQWRNIDAPTNVLSFPIDDIKPGEMPGMLLGDIVMAHETVSREAEQLDISFADHFSHLAIHSFLHIFGYDHIDDKEAGIMETLEQRCMKALGLHDPYC